MAASSQASGFSPGSADRVLLADGRRQFVKAIDRDVNAVGHALHAREAEIMRMLPPATPVPRLSAAVEDGGWIALLLEDVEGVHPRSEDLHRVLGALVDLPEPSAQLAGDLPRTSSELVAEQGGWDRLIDADALEGIDAWTRAHLDELQGASARLSAAVDGVQIVHLDLRTDNVLIDGAGGVWIVDWPWATIGAGWLDGVTYLLDVLMHRHDVDVDGVVRSHPLFADVAPDDIDAVLAGLAGAFLDKARQPAPPGMPTIRSFQAREARAALAWLARRWS
ncbi:phosphotransferase [Microbacterium sp. JZ70]